MSGKEVRMKKFLSDLWNGKPVFVLGAIATVTGVLAATATIPVWIAPVATALAAFVAHGQVTPVNGK
jgi:hypothetical protein